MMTPAFDKYTRPHWTGVYPTRVNPDDSCGWFNYWNGTYWEATTSEPKRLDAEFLRPAAKIQHIEWRGFTKEQLWPHASIYRFCNLKHKCNNCPNRSKQ